jgi:hypothetical protein
MNKTVLMCAAVVAVVLLVTVELIAQPGLPQPPNQAPIDGGLGLLAAAGGAYAWKKLRAKNPKD